MLLVSPGWSWGWFLVEMQDQKSISNKKDYIDLATLKNGCYFTTRTLSNLATEYSETTAMYKSKQSKLVGEIVMTAGTYYSNRSHFARSSWVRTRTITIVFLRANFFSMTWCSAKAPCRAKRLISVNIESDIKNCKIYPICLWRHLSEPLALLASQQSQTIVERSQNYYQKRGEYQNFQWCVRNLTNFVALLKQAINWETSLNRETAGFEPNFLATSHSANG